MLNEKKMAGLLVVILMIIAAFNSMFIVKQYEQAVVFQFGGVVRVVKDPGLSLKIPFIQNVEYFDKRLLNLTDDEKELIAKDQKRVIISAYAKYTIDDPLQLYKSVGNSSGLQTRLTNVLNSALRQVIGEEPLIALLSHKRKEIMTKIKYLVNIEGSKFGVTVHDVRIMRADLPASNSLAVFKRMQSDREKEAKELRAQGEEEAQIITSKAEKEKTIILADAQKKAAIVKGQGEGDAIKIYAETLSIDPDFYKFYRSLEAYKKSFASKDTKIYLSTNDNFMKFFNYNP